MLKESIYIGHLRTYVALIVDNYYCNFIDLFNSCHVNELKTVARFISSLCNMLRPYGNGEKKVDYEL